ncbi:MAG: uroporphyrinogen decarboxylase [Sandaracinus sp.]
MNRVLLDACAKKPTPYTPIWLMRQAGRYQPSYRAIREKVSFMELCRSPALCSEVALRAVDDLGVDAAIVFSDILVVLEPLGIGFEFTKDDGPKIERPVREANDVDRVASEIDAAGSLAYVMEAIRTTKKDLGGRVPLLGFSGAPFTLASYAIEGSGSKEYLHTKKLMYADEGAFSALMGKLADAVGRYLSAQVDAGAEVVQLFDSWIGTLSVEDYVRYVQPHTRRALAPVKGRVPIIHFGTGNPALYPALRDAGGDVIGIDARADLGATWDLLGDVAVQGNLESASLLGAQETLFRKADAVLAGARGRPGHVFNLGHGILPSATIATARALVDYVHEKSARR